MYHILDVSDSESFRLEKTMLDLLIQTFVLIVLLGSVWWGYRRWIQPREGSLDIHGKMLLVLIVLTLMGGLIGGFFWWADEARSFSWDLPALASRMLAAAGWSFVVVCFMALERPSPRRLRLVLLLLATYLTPLVVAILLFHLDRFDASAPITYAFFVIAGGMSAVTIWYLLRQPPVIPDQAQDAAPAARLVTGWLGLIAVLTGLWCLALFVTDSGPLPFVWVWPGDLLTSRLIAVMLLTIAVGAATSLRYADLSQIMQGMTLIYGLGLAVASLWNILVGMPIQPAYLVTFGIIFLGSAALLIHRRLAPPQSSSATTT
jgi:hypothetical protein